MTLEPVRVRSFKMRSGMIGLASRDSRTMKATNSTSATPPKTRVCAETQP